MDAATVLAYSAWNRGPSRKTNPHGRPTRESLVHEGLKQGESILREQMSRLRP